MKTTFRIFDFFFIDLLGNYREKILPIYSRGQIKICYRETRSVVSSGQIRQSLDHFPQQANIPHSWVGLLHTCVFIAIIITLLKLPLLLLLVLLVLVLPVLVFPPGLVASVLIFLIMS